MPGKTEHIQIRVTPRQKAALKRQAAAAGLELSGYLLARALPPAAGRFEQLATALAGDDARFALAELHDLLAERPPILFAERSHLPVFVAQPEYLLALKAVALRLGEEFHDLDDVRYLLRYLNLTRAAYAGPVRLSVCEAVATG